MIRTPKLTMTMRELDRLKCIQGLIDGQLKQHVVDSWSPAAYGCREDFGRRRFNNPRSRRACLGELVQIDGCDRRRKVTDSLT